jgi:hypothetical protein
MQKHRWFATKTYGWGWTPITWQGWACIAGFVTIEILAALLLLQEQFLPWGVFAFLGSILIATMALLLICFKTGEPPRWRWGNN